MQGKTIIPFCTQESSGQRGTYSRIRKLCSGADTLSGLSVEADKVNAKLAFVNGGITYCFENDTMAIFYNQSDNPDLTMRVNCIGRVTSDLSVFRELGDSVEITFDLKK